MSISHLIETNFAQLAPHFFYLGLGAIVFIETALLFAFFIPGDSLLFAAGLIVAQSSSLRVSIACVIAAFSAFAGDQCAYYIGRRYGSDFFLSESRAKYHGLYRRAESFYEKHGISAMALARFYPWLRTLIPLLAGVGRMPYSKFVLVNALSAIGWGAGITYLGYSAAAIPVLENGSRYVAAIVIALTILLIFRNIRKTPRT